MTPRIVSNEDLQRILLELYSRAKNSETTGRNFVDEWCAENNVPFDALMGVGADAFVGAVKAASDDGDFVSAGMSAVLMAFCWGWDACLQYRTSGEGVR